MGSPFFMKVVVFATDSCVCLLQGWLSLKYVTKCLCTFGVKKEEEWSEIGSTASHYS